MNGYVCYFNRNRVEVYAETLYKAQCEAAKLLNVKASKQYLISVVLCERPDGSTVVHTAVD